MSVLDKKHSYSCRTAPDGGAYQESDIYQGSYEDIYIKDSCGITVHTTETQIAASIQAALQVAITLVVTITIADSARAELITAELLQRSQIAQVNRQRIIIENSGDIVVTTTDTDIAVSLQVMVQILVALVAQLDIF